MNIESQVTSLELSKKLNELGVKQDSLFYWADGILVISIEFSILIDENKTRELSGVYNSFPDEVNKEVYSAFTSSELLELLPLNNGDQAYIIIKNGWCEVDLGVITFEDKYLQNALAKKLIYLIENNLLKDKQ